jgi:hypothetical protein
VSRPVRSLDLDRHLTSVCEDGTMTMTFDTKIAVAVRDDLPTWQRLNMTAFLVSGIAAGDGMVGEDYVDASGNRYLPMFRQPVLVYEAPAAKLRVLYERAMRREVRFSLFIDELFATGNDVDNRATMRAVAADDLRIAGLAMRADRKVVDKIFDGVRLHS